MDYFQGLVADYLSDDPAVFVRPECLIRLDETGPLAKGRHWYCDIVAVSFREPRTVYLCEVSYSRTLESLFRRLRQWNEHWDAIRSVLVRDNCLEGSWRTRPWLFVRDECRARVSRVVREILDENDVSTADRWPLVTSLDIVVPALYSSPHRFPSESDADA